MHAYFNVYKRAQEGWNNFLLRRSAVKRLNSLEWATEEQLQQLNDVCCICYEELDSAKVTRCKHFFHSLCLRKWLYVQDRFLENPICDKSVYSACSPSITTVPSTIQLALEEFV